MKAVIKTYAKRPAKANSNLVCCRACLTTEGKLYNMHDHNLVDAFTRITGITVVGDKFPQHLCACCTALLRRCAEFRAKCARAKLCLLSELMTRNLTTEYIRTIDRLSLRLIDLKPTQVVTIDYIEAKVEDVAEAAEVGISDDEQLILNTEENDTQNSSNVDMELDNMTNNEVKINGDVFVIKNVDDILKPKEFKTIRKGKPVKRVRIRKPRNTENAVINGGVKKRRKKRNPKKLFRSAENDYLPVIDFDKFASTYNVKIITLTKEEQLKEIETRRASAKYQKATYRCEPCGKVFAVESIYNNHRMQHSPSMGQHACEICSLRRRRKCDVVRHMDHHRFKYICECGFVSRERHQAKKHYEMHEGKKFVCEHCGKCYNKSTSFMSHVRLAHAEMNVACDMCGEAFISGYGLRMHKSRVHSVKRKQSFKCETCSMVFASPEALNRHTQAGEHVGRSPCKHCGDNFDSQESLESHITDQHPRCDKCSQTFMDAASYATHWRRQHRARRAGPVTPEEWDRWLEPGVCEQCGQVFTNVFKLRAHQQIHSGARFSCPECPKSFNYEGLLKAHLRTHTGEKPYQCDHCKLYFNYKTNLKRHMLVLHLGKRLTIPCEICGRTFTTTGSMRLHINTVHLGMPWPKRKRRSRPKPETKNTE